MRARSSAYAQGGEYWTHFDLPRSTLSGYARRLSWNASWVGLRLGDDVFGNGNVVNAHKAWQDMCDCLTSTGWGPYIFNAPNIVCRYCDISTVDLLFVELLLAGLGVGELQKYLDDPMSDPYVRRDEETRSTTVEHVKLLRNRLEATTQEHLTELQSYLVRTTANLSRKVEDTAVTGRGNGKRSGDDARRNELEGIFNAKVDEFDQKMIARTSKLEERVGVLVDSRLSVFEERLAVVL